MTTIACAYCDAEVEGYDVPAVDDDAGWEEEAAQHLDTCEWVATRAHRLLPTTTPEAP